MGLHKSEMFGQQPEPHTRPHADIAPFLTLIPVWDDPDSRHQGVIYMLGSLARTHLDSVN